MAKKSKASSRFGTRQGPDHGQKGKFYFGIWDWKLSASSTIMGFYSYSQIVWHSRFIREVILLFQLSIQELLPYFIFVFLFYFYPFSQIQLQTYALTSEYSLTLKPKLFLSVCLSICQYVFLFLSLFSLFFVALFTLCPYLSFACSTVGDMLDLYLRYVYLNVKLNSTAKKY